MSERLYALRATRSFVDYSAGGSPISVSRGALIQRTAAEAERLDKLVEFVPSDIERMVMIAKDNHVAFVTNNPEVIDVCKEFGVSYHDPITKRNGKGH